MQLNSNIDYIIKHITLAGYQSIIHSDESRNKICIS